MALIVTLGSIPLMKPLWDRYFGEGRNTTQNLLETTRTKSSKPSYWRPHLDFESNPDLLIEQTPCTNVGSYEMT